MIDFPSGALTVGQIFTAAGVSWKWNGTKWVSYIVGAPGAAIIQTGDAPPSVPVNGNAWYDTTDTNLYVWYNDGTSSQWVPTTNLAGLQGPQGATGPTGPIGPGNGVGRNFLHNSMFNVAQRGAGPFTANTNYTLDRWQVIVLVPDTVSISQTGLTDADRAAIGDEAAKFCLQNTFVGNASGYQFIDHKIEDVRRLAGKTVTASFWAKAATGTPKLGVNLEQNFGAGGSPSAGGWTQATGASLTLSTSWARYSVSITVPSIAGKTLGTNGGDYSGLGIFYSSGASLAANAGNIGVQSGTIQVWGVQLEIGSTATQLEKPDPRYDLANCQRFYTTFTNVGLVCAFVGGYSGSTSNITLPVTMRANPTIVTTHTGGSGSYGALSQSGIQAIMLWLGGSPIAGNYETFNVTCSADL